MNPPKIEKNRPKRTPYNLFEYISNRSPNDDFLSQMTKHSESIRSILTAENTPLQLGNALFIIEFNNFKEDLIRMTKSLDKIQSKENKIRLLYQTSKEALHKINSKELISRMSQFYDMARNYDEDFGIKEWLIKSNGKPLKLMKIWSPEIPFHYEEKATNAENAYKAYNIFTYYDEYFKNFINTIYGDEKEGIEFLDRKFSEVIDEYLFLKESSEKIKKHLQADEISVSTKKIEAQKKDIETILKKYPATVYLAVIEIIKFHDTEDKHK